MKMYPPGRIMFMRPLKTIKIRRRSDEKVEKRLEKSWDAIWVTPQELIAEGILVSKQVSQMQTFSHKKQSLHQNVQSKACTTV